MMLYVIGDIHGDLFRTKQLLKKEGVIDGENRWVAGNSLLVCTGDLVDRGPHGLEVIEFFMSLQDQAREAGGLVESLMGNHDAAFVSVAKTTLLFDKRFGMVEPERKYIFNYNGGNVNEIFDVCEKPHLIDWLANRPMVLRVGQTLLQHADSARFYRRLAEHGEGVDFIERVNSAGKKLMCDDDGAWRVFDLMTDSRRWDHSFFYGDVKEYLLGYLAESEAECVIHGHTPTATTEPFVYHDGLAICVDGALSCGYRNDPDRGFIFKIELQ